MRDHLPTSENIQVPIPIKVKQCDARAAASCNRQLRPGEISFPIIQVQSILVHVRAFIIFTSSAYHVQIKITVTISIEEGGAHIFIFLVSLKCSDRFLYEPAVLLYVKTASLALCTSNIKIFCTVAIH